MNISTKTEILVKIFWDADLRPRYDPYMKKTRALKSHATLPLKLPCRNIKCREAFFLQKCTDQLLTVSKKREFRIYVTVFYKKEKGMKTLGNL